MQLHWTLPDVPSIHAIHSAPFPPHSLCIFSTAAKTEQKSSACIGVQSDFATVWLDRAPGNDASLCAVLLGLVQSELHTRNYQ